MHKTMFPRIFSSFLLISRLSVADDQPSARQALPVEPDAQQVAQAKSSKIWQLTSAFLPSIRNHVMALNERDRYMRFGIQVSDEQVRDYINHIDFERDEVFGIFGGNGQLLGMAQLAYNRIPLLLGDSADKAVSNMAEFGVSVNSEARGMGLGGRLFAYSAKRAASKGIEQMFIHTVNKNIPMIKIIKRAGAAISRDEGDIDAYLALPANNPWLHMHITSDGSEINEDGYGIKVALDNLKDSSGDSSS